VVPCGDTGPAHHTSTRAIQGALAKALKWNDALITGAVPSMNALAKSEGVTQRYIAHLIKLAWLAPEIMEAIARGHIPSSVSLDRLKKGVPLDWEEQRKTLRFTV
jgi:site-specific DNA recombinase